MDNKWFSYGNILGWSTKGNMACPKCNKDTSHVSLRSKIGYNGYHRYFLKNHAMRLDMEFDETRETWIPQKNLYGEDIFEQLSCLQHIPFNKNSIIVRSKRKRASEKS